MQTTASKQPLLPDDVWAAIPPASADRRFVGGVLLVLLLMIPTVIIGNATGILTPRLSYVGGETTAHARTHTLTIGLIIQNESSRSWRVTGATVAAPGTRHAIAMRSVTIAAHQRRTIDGVIHMSDCGAVATTSTEINGFPGAVKLRVQRLFGTSAVTISSVVDAPMVTMACAK